MFWTKTFIPTLKEIPQEAESLSHQLMLRAALARMLMAGVYSYLPLGLRVLNNIEKIIRQEMNAAGGAELLLPALQPKELWVKSGRDQVIGEVMIKFIDRRGRHVCLGPTHEEVITDLAGSYVSSYRQLPLLLYQIQTKFRDEIRPRFGLVRSCEFIMKDAYSFDKDQNGLEKNYQLMLDAYRRIFTRCGLNFLTTAADSGVMGGSVSHEFMVPADFGEDIVLVCQKCGQAFNFKGEIGAALSGQAPNPKGGIGAALSGQAKTFKSDSAQEKCPQCNAALNKINTLEVGHIFQLGTKYSAALGANFVDEKGRLCPIIMGCYGIGVSRLIPAIIEENHDKDGIIWPKEVSPYQAIILALDVTDRDIFEKAAGIYRDLKDNGIEALLDDRDERAGVKFKDADLLGVPVGIIIGKKTMSEGKVEIKTRKDQVSFLVEAKDIIRITKEIA